MVMYVFICLHIKCMIGLRDTNKHCMSLLLACVGGCFVGFVVKSLTMVLVSLNKRCIFVKKALKCFAGDGVVSERVGIKVRIDLMQFDELLWIYF